MDTHRTAAKSSSRSPSGPGKSARTRLKPYLDAIDAAGRQLSADERAVVVRFLNDLVDKIAHAPRPQDQGE